MDREKILAILMFVTSSGNADADDSDADYFVCVKVVRKCFRST